MAPAPPRTSIFAISFPFALRRLKDQISSKVKFSSLCDRNAKGFWGGGSIDRRRDDPVYVGHRGARIDVAVGRFRIEAEGVARIEQIFLGAEEKLELAIDDDPELMAYVAVEFGS